METVLQLIAMLSAGLFAGAAAFDFLVGGVAGTVGAILLTLSLSVIFPRLTVLLDTGTAMHGPNITLELRCSESLRSSRN
jgi:hypothetical protein